ncbi:hypothetical protein BJX96DRAFT_184271 [Aspergillus floccosus]
MRHAYPRQAHLPVMTPLPHSPTCLPIQYLTLHNLRVVSGVWMDTYKGSSIYSWLAAIETPESSPHHGQWADNHLSPTGINPSPYTGDGQCSHSNKVKHGFSVAVNQQAPTLGVLNGTNEQEKQHCYERRPRHKTKSDRYEYKGRASARGWHRSSSKPRQRLSRARKHTINDHLHAFNVPTKRLTLLSCTATGIFGKGKASSPVRTSLQKHLSAPVQSFSEVNFLSHYQPQHNFEEACVTPHAVDGADQSQRGWATTVRLEQDSLYQSLGSQFKDTAECPVRRTLPHSSVIQCNKLKFQDLDSCQISDHGVLDIAKHDSDRNNRRDNAQTPSDLYEMCTKQLLDFDLDAQPTALNSVAEDLTLERLKDILKERMKTWDQNTKGLPESDDQRQSPDCRKRIQSSPIDSESDAIRSYKKQRMLGPSPVKSMAKTEGFHVPSHDFDLYSQTSSVADVLIRDQQQAELETPTFFPDLEGPSATARSESGLLDRASDVDKKLRSTLRLDGTEEICSQTFLAAYSMIMRDTGGCSGPQSSGALSHESCTWLISGHQDAHDLVDNAASLIGSGGNKQTRDFLICQQPGVATGCLELDLGKLDSTSVKRQREVPWHTNDAKRQQGDVSDTLEGFWRKYQLHWWTRGSLLVINRKCIQQRRYAEYTCYQLVRLGQQRAENID